MFSPLTTSLTVDGETTKQHQKSALTPQMAGRAFEQEGRWLWRRVFLDLGCVAGSASGCDRMFVTASCLVPQLSWGADTGRVAPA